MRPKGERGHSYAHFVYRTLSCQSPTCGLDSIDFFGRAITDLGTIIGTFHNQPLSRINPINQNRSRRIVSKFGDRLGTPMDPRSLPNHDKYISLAYTIAADASAVNVTTTTDSMNPDTTAKSLDASHRSQ